MLTMARPKSGKKGGRPTSENPKRRVVSFRCSEAFGVWLEGLENETRLPVPVIVEHALIKWAKDVAGYEVEAPKR